MSKKRRQFSAEFKAKVALEALKEQKTINQIASQYDVLPAQISQWKGHLLKQLPVAFERSREAEDLLAEREKTEKHLYQKIGQLQVERDWLKKKAKQLGLLSDSEAIDA